MKRYKRAEARRISDKALKIIKGMKHGDAVAVLTVALTDAIWREGGEREDAMATADIVHHALCLGLSQWFDLEDRSAPLNVVPFKRNKKYFKT